MRKRKLYAVAVCALAHYSCATVAHDHQVNYKKEKEELIHSIREQVHSIRFIEGETAEHGKDEISPQCNAESPKNREKGALIPYSITPNYPFFSSLKRVIEEIKKRDLLEYSEYKDKTPYELLGDPETSYNRYISLKSDGEFGEKLADSYLNLFPISFHRKVLQTDRHRRRQGYIHSTLQ